MSDGSLERRRGAPAGRVSGSTSMRALSAGGDLGGVRSSPRPGAVWAHVLLMSAADDIARGRSPRLPRLLCRPVDGSDRSATAGASPGRRATSSTAAPPRSRGRCAATVRADDEHLRSCSGPSPAQAEEGADRAARHGAGGPAPARGRASGRASACRAPDGPTASRSRRRCAAHGRTGTTPVIDAREAPPAG